MRKLSWVEYCDEVQKNSKNLRKIVIGLREKPGESVPDNFVKMAEEDLEKNGVHYIDNFKLKRIEENVLVERECEEDEYNKINKDFNRRRKVDNDMFMVAEWVDNVYKIRETYKLVTVDIFYDAKLFDVMTTTEAALKWGLNESTVRKAIKENKFRLGYDYRKSGRITLISREAMERRYGKLEE